MKKLSCLTAALLLSFLMGIQDGYIALWKTGEDAPLKVFPYQASSLPPADQQRLKEGIVIESGDELNRLIEDYFS